MLESDMAHAYYQGSNKDMTATDTQKNTVRSTFSCLTSAQCFRGIDLPPKLTVNVLLKVLP